MSLIGLLADVSRDPALHSAIETARGGRDPHLDLVAPPALRPFMVGALAADAPVGAGRPVLAGDPAGTWRRILAERVGLYRQVADLVLDTTGLTAAEAAWRIVGDAHRPRRSESHP